MVLMMTGGVQKDGSLGFQSPQQTEALLGRSVAAAMEAQEVEVRRLQKALEAERAEHGATAAELQRVRCHAWDLYAALKTVTAFVRENPPTDRDGDLVTVPADVAEATEALMILHEYDNDQRTAVDEMPLPPCPECVAGKHQNCTGEVLVEDDEGRGGMVECGCRAGGHGEAEHG